MKACDVLVRFCIKQGREKIELKHRWNALYMDMSNMPQS